MKFLFWVWFFYKSLNILILSRFTLIMLINNTKKDTNGLNFTKDSLKIAPNYFLTVLITKP